VGGGEDHPHLSSDLARYFRQNVSFVSLIARTLRWSVEETSLSLLLSEAKKPACARSHAMMRAAGHGS
jgi:hypothetical protein